ncbi:hypothetical protein [Tateyamaria pelophila]|uniref:hypothetical protein n=1 Tax=Tateyamaria pelophila TaxID=328415 RepID=UPI001CBFB795|nr:hypothetical protein [Tateyamaria pelophila]
MTPIQRTLLAIAAFVALALSLFIWFIANWDKSKTQPIGHLINTSTHKASLFILPNKLRGLGQSPSLAGISKGTAT